MAGEFTGELLLAAVLDGVGTRRQDHVDLEFLFGRVFNRLSELRGPIRRVGRKRGAGPSSTSAAASAHAFGGGGEHGTGAGDQGGKKAVELAGFEDVRNARRFADLGGGDHVAGPGLLRGIGTGDEDHLAELPGAGCEHEGGAGLGEAGEVEEVVLLAEGPVDIVGVVAGFGGVKNEDGAVADLVHQRLAAGGEVFHPVALPGGGRRRGDLPDAGIGGEGADGQGERAEKLGDLHRPSGWDFPIIGTGWCRKVPLIGLPRWFHRSLHSCSPSTSNPAQGLCATVLLSAILKH